MSEASEQAAENCYEALYKLYDDLAVLKTRVERQLPYSEAALRVHYSCYLLEKVFKETIQIIKNEKRLQKKSKPKRKAKK